MKTIKDLKFEKFNAKDETVQSTSIPFETFAASVHNYKSNSPVPYSGLQIMEGIKNQIDLMIPDSNRSFGDVFVYRNQYSAPNYVKKLTGHEPEGVKLLTPETPITDLNFPRFIGTIEILGDKNYSENIAVKCDDNKTIQVAYGLNVRVCSNFTIFAKNFIQTNVREKRGYEWIMQEIGEYLKTVEGRFNYDLGMVRKLQEIEMPMERQHQLIGEMLYKYETPKEIIPVTMITEFSRQIKRVEVQTAWDFVNAGTEIIRFDSNTGDSIIETMANFVDFSLEKNELEYSYL